MTELGIDPAVAERMGYPNLVAASGLDLEGLMIEFALLEPDLASGERQWCVAIHFDCDPEDPSRGTSGMEPCGNDRDEAENYYLSRIAEVADGHTPRRLSAP